MDIKSLAKGLAYVGEAQGKRQTYYIFEGRKHFFVMSFSRAKRNAGNFNIVSPEAVAYVRKRFAGARGLTSQDVVKRSRRPRLIRTALEALNILYILVATGEAKVDQRRQATPQLFFNLSG
jgi:hypothetical protein